MAYDDNAAYEQGVPCSQQQQLPPDAPCAFYFHGLMSSRLERHPAAGPFGVRIITIDRPGQGMSDHCHYTYEDFSGFVCELADIIGIRKFGVVGFSSGGPYALAMAYVICLSSLLLFSSKLTLSLLLQLLSSCSLDRLLHYWRRSSPRFPGVFQNRRVQRGAGHHVPRKIPRFDPAYLFHFLVFSFSCALQAPATPLHCALLWEHSWRPPRLPRRFVASASKLPRSHACSCNLRIAGLH